MYFWEELIRDEEDKMQNYLSKRNTSYPRFVYAQAIARQVVQRCAK